MIKWCSMLALAEGDISLTSATIVHAIDRVSLFPDLPSFSWVLCWSSVLGYYFSDLMSTKCIYISVVS